MSQSPAQSEIKQKLQKYGLLLGYCFLGMIGTAAFSYKLVKIRLLNMQNRKTKSRIPILHKNMKYFMMGGISGVILYSYGLFKVIGHTMNTSTIKLFNNEDQAIMKDDKRMNPELQDLYIIKSMEMFGVRNELIEKTKKEFADMDPQGKYRENAGITLSFDLFKALLKKRMMEKGLISSTENKNQ